MQKIIDSHVHISGFGEKDLASCFDEYMEENGVSSVNVCAIPMRHSSVANNILAGFYKLARPHTYVHGGIELIEIPIDDMPADMDAVTQYHELMEMGFDGIKMLEGKPTEHKRIGKNLNHPALNALYREMERDGTHLLMHVNDPDEFWDLDRAPDWAIKSGWTYTDGTYSSYREIQRQAIKILEDHPNLTITFAHLFFCGKEPELLEELFAKYPNLAVDLTAGGEMYVAFEANYDYYYTFFRRYADRLIFGTDSSYHGDKKYADWLFHVVTTFLATSDTVMSFDNKPLKGLGLDEAQKNAILYGNFESRAGKEPKKMDKEKFKAYIEKYSFALSEEDKKNIKPLMEKYLQAT